MKPAHAPGLGPDPGPYLAALRRSSFGAGLVFLDPEAQSDLRVFYGFCRAVDDCADDFPLSEGRAYLAQWRRALASPAALGRSRAPLARALASYCQRRRVPVALLRELAEGAASDLRPQVRFARRADLKRYCHQVAGVVGLACLPLFGVELKRGRRFAELLGRGFQLINIIRDLAEDARRGRVYLCLEDLRRHQVPLEQVLDLKMSPGLEAVLAEYAVWAEACLRKAGEEALAAELDPRSLRPALVMRDLYHALLKTMRHHRFSVAHQRHRLSLFTKARILLLSQLRDPRLIPSV